MEIALRFLRFPAPKNFAEAAKFNNIDTVKVSQHNR
jgi:hypothetical protein